MKNTDFKSHGIKFCSSLFLNPSSRWYYPFRWMFLIGLGLAIYAQTFGFGFVFDDYLFIVNNPYITRFDHLHFIWNIFPKTRAIGFYSFALNYFFNHTNPQGYHIVNFIIHLVAVGFVWGIARVIFRITGVVSQELPFVVAVLFLVHPCQTQAVTYISQRFESLATVFYLGTIYCYLCARLSSSKFNRFLLFISSFVFAVLGIFTKEVTATIPLMLLAIEFIFFNKDAFQADDLSLGNVRKKFPWKIFIVLMVGGGLFFILFTKLVRTDLNIFFHFTPIPSESHDGDMITAKNYLLTQMRIFMTFLRLLVLPINQNLDYDYPLSTGLFDPPSTLLGASCIAAVLLIFFRIRQKYPVIAFGLAWILITFSINLAPRSNIIFEHKLYLISFGFFLILINVSVILIRQRKIFFSLMIGLIVLWSTMSFMRNRVWEGQLTLWQDVVGKSPHKARALNNLGLAFYYEGNFDQAIDEYTKAINAKPVYPEAYINRALAFASRGHFIQAIDDDDKAIKMDPGNAQAFNNRGIVYYNEGNYLKAMSDYDQSIERNSNFAEAYFNRATIYDQQGDFTQALLDYNKAIDENFTKGYYNRGLLYAKEGDYPKALRDFDKSIELNPQQADVYGSRGLLYAKRLEFSNAISDYNKVIEINPEDAQAYNDLGLMYTNLDNLSEALGDFNKAIAINPHFAQVYYNRAVIYYHLKQYDKALADVDKMQILGVTIDSKFIYTLRLASGKKH